MIVYAEPEERVCTEPTLREIERIDDSVERLIRYGQWESGVLDALCPIVDDVVDELGQLPEMISIRPQEGFAYYALYPEQYAAAARRFAQEKRPSACVVIGIRSIGTTLSTVVAESLDCAVWRFTVRPRGHPFDRRLLLSEQLQARIRSHARDWFLIVDEGPGLSGTSFVSVADALAELGVPAEKIVFFPSHEPDPDAFVSERARACWPRHAVYVEPFVASQYVPDGARDLSGGKWRELLGCEAEVVPAHERRKYLHDGRLWKFSGLAQYGRSKFERCRELADFTTPAVAMENGFLVTKWVEGVPAVPPSDVAARYLEYVAVRYATGKHADYESLAKMIEVNTGLQMPSSKPVIEEQGTVAIDGRMLPHEWIRTTAGEWIKTDALDHHDDHFFPGCQDIAWDLAAASLEMGIDVLSTFAPQPHLPERVEFYSIAYLAYRIGYCSMFGLDKAKERYTAALVGRMPCPAISIV